MLAFLKTLPLERKAPRLKFELDPREREASVRLHAINPSVGSFICFSFLPDGHVPRELKGKLKHEKQGTWSSGKMHSRLKRVLDGIGRARVRNEPGRQILILGLFVGRHITFFSSPVFSFLIFLLHPSWAWQESRLFASVFYLSRIQ